MICSVESTNPYITEIAKIPKNSKIISNISVGEQYLCLMIYTGYNHLVLVDTSYTSSINKDDTEQQNKHITYILLQDLVSKEENCIISNYGKFVCIVNQKGYISFYYDGRFVKTDIKLDLPLLSKPIIEDKQDHYKIYITTNHGVIKSISYKKENHNVNINILEQLPSQPQVIYEHQSSPQIYKEYLVIPGQNGSISIFKNQKLFQSILLQKSFIPIIKLVEHKKHVYVIADNYLGKMLSCYTLQEAKMLWQIKGYTLSLPLSYRDKKIYMLATKFMREKNNDKQIFKKKYLLLLINLLSGTINKKFDINKLIANLDVKINQVYNFFVTKYKVILFTDIGIFVFDQFYKCRRIFFIIKQPFSLQINNNDDDDVYFLHENIIYKIY